MGTITLYCGAEESYLELPTAATSDLAEAELPEPDPDPNRAPLSIEYEPRWRVIHDGAAGTVEVETGLRWRLMTPSHDGTITIDHRGRARLDPQHPAEASAEATTRVALETPSRADVNVTARLTATASSLRLTGDVEVDGDSYFSREWTS